MYILEKDPHAYYEAYYVNLLHGLNYASIECHSRFLTGQGTKQRNNNYALKLELQISALPITQCVQISFHSACQFRSDCNNVLCV